MISESWFAIDSDDSPLRNREITTVMLGQRFDDTVIRRLLRLRWWDLSEKLIIALQYDSIDQCLDALENIKDIDRCRSVNEFISV